MIRVTISRDGVWAGEGRWTDDCEIVDCPAVLGRDQDESDDIYEALCDALAGLPQDGDMWEGPAVVQRAGGVYEACLARV